VPIDRGHLQLLGAMLAVGALYSHYLGHSVLLFEIILLAAGTLLVLWSLKGIKIAGEKEHSGMLSRFLMRYLSGERCAVIIPLSGLVILLSWSVWKIFLLDSTNLRMEDFIVTLLGLSLILYYSGPSKYHREKDFIFFYLLFMTIIFVVIWKSYSFATGDSTYRINAYSEYYFITKPVVFLLKTFGMEVNAVLKLSGIGLSNIIEYQYEGRFLRVGIGLSCSGLYSAGLFFSAFLAFVLVRYSVFNPPILIGLTAGLIATWASNIIRMTVTIIIGMKFGPPALAAFHMYFGILLFIIIITIFWILIVKWLDHTQKPPQIEDNEETQSISAGIPHESDAELPNSQIISE